MNRIIQIHIFSWYQVGYIHIVWLDYLRIFELGLFYFLCFIPTKHDLFCFQRWFVNF